MASSSNASFRSTGFWIDPRERGALGVGRMRFEVAAAWAVGILLPLLETARRGLGHWAVEATTMLEDYLAGGVLLGAAWAAERSPTIAPRLLLVAWSGVATMMTLSFVGQVEETLRGDDLEAHNSVVLVVKLLLWATCVVALAKSFRSIPHPARDQGKVSR